MRYWAWILAACSWFPGASWAQAEATPPAAPGFGSGVEADELLAAMLQAIRAHYQDRIRAAEKNDPQLADRVRAEMIQAEFRIAAARLFVRAERFEEAAAELRGFLRDGTGSQPPEPLSGKATAAPAAAPAAPLIPVQAAGHPESDERNWVRVPVGVSVTGPGYFRVLSPTGEEAYAKAGSLALDPDGRMVFQSGTVKDAHEYLPLLPVIVIDKPLHRLIVNRDGSVQIKSPDGTTPFSGQIELAVFPHGEDDLLPDGNGVLYRAPTGAAPEYYTPGPGSPAGSIVQGASR